MEIISSSLPCTSKQLPGNNTSQPRPFSQEWITITKEEQISLSHQANYWKAQHAIETEERRARRESKNPRP